MTKYYDLTGQEIKPYILDDFSKVAVIDYGTTNAAKDFQAQHEATCGVTQIEPFVPFEVPWSREPDEIEDSGLVLQATSTTDPTVTPISTPKVAHTGLKWRWLMRKEGTNHYYVSNAYFATAPEATKMITQWMDTPYTSVLPVLETEMEVDNEK
jgi:hypothetical protein